ncbi:MAG: hypothetical protein ACXWW5_00825 [Actinomycetota bacterium]
MSDRGGARGLLTRPPTWLFVALIAVRILVLTLVIADAHRHAVDDPVVLRAERVATSPARPYRDFPVGAMPIETFAARALGGDGAGTTAGRIALLAFAGDLAAAGAVFWGWGRRPAAMYLLIGLPLLSFIYLRFDLVSVAFAAWGVALLRRRGDEPIAGAALGLGVWAKLWPLVLMPLLVIVRAKRAAVTVAAILLAGGAVWYLQGGPKGPLQVLTQRGAIGWSVESTIGNLLTLVTGSSVAPEGGVARIGAASTPVKGALLVGLLVCEAAIWWRATADDRDPSGGTAIAAIATVLVFAPILSVGYVAWLLPWAAFAFEGDPPERRAASLAVAAVAITGLLGLTSPLAAPGIFEELAILARNGALIAIVVVWLTVGARIRGREGRVAVAQS